MMGGFHIICEYAGGNCYLLSLRGHQTRSEALRAIAWQHSGQPVTGTTFHITQADGLPGTFGDGFGRTFEPLQGCFTRLAWATLLDTLWPEQTDAE